MLGCLVEKLPLLTQGRPCTLCYVLAGFRRLGFGYLVSSLAVPFIHGSFSYPSNPGIIPDPFFRIWLKNVHRTKHGSDSGESDSVGALSLQLVAQSRPRPGSDNLSAWSWQA